MTTRRGETTIRLSFGGQEDLYHAVRPGYQSPLLFDLIDRPRRSGRALDIGCGSGALTRVVADQGFSVTGIDPDERMARKAASLGSTVLHGSVTDYLAIDNEDLELVVCAQAWHWLSAADRLAVCRRVEKSQGRLLLVWNLSDANVDVATARLHEAYYLSLPANVAELCAYVEADAPIDLRAFRQQLRHFGLTQTAMSSTGNQIAYNTVTVVNYFKTVSSSSLLSQSEWAATERRLCQEMTRWGGSTLTFRLVTIMAQAPGTTGTASASR